MAEIRIATALDPVSVIANTVEAHVLYMAGRHDESIAKSLLVIDMDPNFPEAWEYLKRAYDQKGMFREAIAARQTRRRILGSDASETPALRGAAAATSAAAYWKYRLEQELVEARTEGVLPFEFAEILAQAGDTSQALDWLERACAEHDFLTVYVMVAPNLKPLHREPATSTSSAAAAPSRPEAPQSESLLTRRSSRVARATSGSRFPLPASGPRPRNPAPQANRDVVSYKYMISYLNEASGLRHHR